MEKRRATYTINVPIQITFATDNDLTPEELFEQSKAEVLKRLANGYFDVLLEKVDVVSKIKHRSREEIAEENRAWESFFSSLRGLR